MAGYTQFGHGDHKVLTLHGWFGDETTFEALRPALDPNRFSYVSLAYRGYGASKHLDGAFSIDEIASDAIALADSLGWDRFSLIGHSMGGKAAQKVLAATPDRIRKIAGVAPVPAFPVPFDEATWNLLDGAAGSAENRYAIVDFSTGNRLSRSWVNSVVAHSMKTARPEAVAAYLNAWAKTDISAEVKGKPVPIKIFTGRHDASIPEEVVRATFVPLFPNSEIQVIENAGHYPIDETPLFLATEIEVFLGRDN